MYEYIQGTLKEKEPDKAVVETAGIGYRLAIPLSTYTRLPACGSTLLLHLSHVVREDSETLYAFVHREERDLFEVLITLSGIGPKTAIGIVGHMEISAFQRAIASADTRLLNQIPGIGKKTAERLVIEMRDKFKAKGKSPLLPAALGELDGLIGDAMNALVHLGYNAFDAQKAVQKALSANQEEKDLARLITASLRHL